MEMYIRAVITLSGKVSSVKIKKCECNIYNTNIGGICHRCGGALLTFDEILAE